MGKAAGQITEAYFSSILYANGLDYTFVNDWYDYEVNGIKIELKSCQMSVKCNNKTSTSRRPGRFDFTSRDNKEEQEKENMWIALIIRHRKQCIFFGFVHSKDITQKRYLSLHKAMELQPLTFKDWLKKTGLRKKTKRICPLCGRGLENGMASESKQDSEKKEE